MCHVLLRETKVENPNAVFSKNVLQITGKGHIQTKNTKRSGLRQREKSKGTGRESREKQDTNTLRNAVRQHTRLRSEGQKEPGLQRVSKQEDETQVKTMSADESR